MSLSPFDRTESLNRLRTDDFDVVVIGGGVTGAGVALDAASRGLRTALVERDDFSSGTSSKSSKLVHGGLRYLQQGEIGLVYEALHERQRLLTNAPHLVTPLPFLLPMFGKGGVIPAKISRLLGSAMWGYDITGGYRIGKLHKRVDKAEALEYMPTLRADRLVSGYLFYDASTDDSRLVVALLRTAALHHGAVIANRVGVTRIAHGPSGAASAVIVDADGEQIEISARSVVNAAGVWSDEVRCLDEGADPDSIRPAKGIHITVPHHLVGNTIAAVIPVPKDRRSVFVVPQGDLCYIGTTDTDFDGSLDDPQCTPDDVDYLLSAINAVSVNTITREDIVGSWAGLRPLVKSAESGRTADLSRRHRVNRSESGVISITGGKLTTYRRMAADTVDEVVSLLGSDVPAGSARSRSKRLRLRGADGYESVLDIGDREGLTDADLAHLAGRFGGESRVLVTLVAERPELGEKLCEGLPYLAAEAVFAARYEMAQSVDDVLSRRTRARILGAEAAVAAADRVAELIAPELGWSKEQAAASAEEFRTWVHAERRAAGLADPQLDDSEKVPARR